MTAAFITSNEHAAGNDYSPNLGASNTGQRVTRVEARAPFLYRAHPERWQVIGGKVLPLLGRLPLVPGVNAVELDERTGALRVQTAQAEARERGWTVIPTSVVPPESGRSSYLYRPAGRPDVTLCIYERCFPGSSVTQSDDAGWIRFLEFLIEEGHVEPVPMYVLERMRAATASRLEKAMERAARTPGVTSGVDKVREDLEVIEAAIAARTESAEPAEGDEFHLDVGDQVDAPAKPRKRGRK